jgi:hypothetical protein
MYREDRRMGGVGMCAVCVWGDVLLKQKKDGEIGMSNQSVIVQLFTPLTTMAPALIEQVKKYNTNGRRRAPCDPSRLAERHNSGCIRRPAARGKF